MIVEWNEYLNHEIETIVNAVMQIMPAIGSMAGSGIGKTTDGIIKLTEQNDISDFFDSLNKGN